MRSPYVQQFGRDNINWSPDQSFNELFLRTQVRYWNDVLRARGHVFLNEVYASLGFDHTAEGAVVGWSIHSPYGNGWITFNDAPAEEAGEGVLWLDFNVDGVILGYLKPKK